MLLIVVFVPLVVGLFCVLLPQWAKGLSVLPCLVTAGVSGYLLGTGKTVNLCLLDSFGVSLLADPTAAWFLMTNALVCLAVAWHERLKAENTFFLMLLTLLHGCLNACFLSADLFNLYVVIELTTIIAFLLVGRGMKTTHFWNALRYLFLNNVGMLFFLLGTIMVYESCGNFKLSSVALAPPTARALIVTGLLVKGGVFLPGLWLPQAHAEADTAVSALLSGVVVNIGLLPLIRLANDVPDLLRPIRILGMAGALLGLGLGFYQRDIKRLLACSTISQVGFILVAPAVGAFYAFGHGLAKACLFLSVSGLPNRDLVYLRKTNVPRSVLWPIRLAALSIAGCPLLVGFSTKSIVFESLSSIPYAVMTGVAIGTAALMARLIFVSSPVLCGRGHVVWSAPLLLCLPLILIGVGLGSYEMSAWLKAGGGLVVGVLLHELGLKRLMSFTLPNGWEKLEHVVGLTCMILLALMLIGGLT
ncbi:proton-conducting transporter membrane subunit [Planctomycetota bacterium]